jgi:hypothetical protein
MYEVKTQTVTKKSAIIILIALSLYNYHFRLALFDFLANAVSGRMICGQVLAVGGARSAINRGKTKVVICLKRQGVC